MPSNPKIPRKRILDTALDILTQDGYGAVNIKSVANKLNCSTQPISWQFGGMEGLRRELTEAAKQYVTDTYYRPAKDILKTFQQTGWGSIDLAIDEPNLFRFLYMGESGQKPGGSILHLFECGGTAETRRVLAELLNVTLEEAGRFMTTMILYTQGLAALIASGVIRDERDDIHRMVQETAVIVLRGLGVAQQCIDALLRVVRDDGAGR